MTFAQRVFLLAFVIFLGGAMRNSGGVTVFYSAVAAVFAGLFIYYGSDGGKK